MKRRSYRPADTTDDEQVLLENIVAHFSSTYILTLFLPVQITDGEKEDVPPPDPLEEKVQCSKTCMCKANGQQLFGKMFDSCKRMIVLSMLQKAKAASFKTRTASTIAMIAGFLVMIYLGHVPLMFLVFTLQVIAVV